jgi:hypothetical protein
MSEDLVHLIASFEVIIAWLGCGYFIWLYATRSPWRETLVGRTMMQGRVSMFALLTYALTSRWMDPVPWLQVTLGLVVYALIAGMEWRQAFVVRYAQKGNITPENPNYTPVTDWFRKHFGHKR